MYGNSGTSTVLVEQPAHCHRACSGHSYEKSPVWLGGHVVLFQIDYFLHLNEVFMARVIDNEAR